MTKQNNTRLTNIISQIARVNDNTTTAEERIDYFFREVFNRVDKINHAVANELFGYMTSHSADFSLFEHQSKYAGIRRSNIYRLIYLLDRKGWQDSNGEQYENSQDNLMEISYRIFGDKGYKNSGIIDTLTAKNNGALGIYDALVFRLISCGNRQGSYYNLYNALGWHHDPMLPRGGDITELATNQIRELSQYIFKIFKTRYIDKKVNIFTELCNYDITNYFGAYKKEITERLNIEEVNIEREKIKNGCISLILFQLSSTDKNMNIGCGNYDEKGVTDSLGIRKTMQRYIFDICFSPGNPDNFRYFLDYLLFHLELNTSPGGNKNYTVSYNRLIEVLDPNHLKRYWLANKGKIKKYSRTNRDNKVYTYNYIANYEEDTEAFFKKLIEEFGY